MKKVSIKSPTRVDLAGGTLDLWPLYNFTGGAKTVNLAISIFTYADIEELPGEAIELVSADLNLKKSFSSLSDCLQAKDPELHLLQVQLKYWQPWLGQKGFRLSTRSESPVGGGLGGSSSLTISLLKAFSEWTGRKFSSTEQMVNVAHNIEAEILNTPTGTQDYFPAASGGLNIISYNFEGLSQKVLPIQGSEIEKHFLLAYTGKAHHSGLNNFEVMKGAVGKDSKTLQALYDLKQIAEETSVLCQESLQNPKVLSKLPGLFQREFKARVQLAPAFSSPEIEKLSTIALRAGAEGVKICGAGGGGCVLIWAAPSVREGVIQACQSEGFKILPAKPVDPLPNPLPN
ncbi:MAG: dehydrogenase [Oligoflexia bacterium]|nr:MAG: dehydrogenase [Oligoflexia bacterium]